MLIILKHIPQSPNITHYFFKPQLSLRGGTTKQSASFCSLSIKPKLSLRGGTTKQSARLLQSAYYLKTTAKIGQIASLAALVRNDSFCLKKYCVYEFRKEK